MKVQRLIDGATGWAVQMAGTFTCEGRVYPGQTYVVALGTRRVMAGPDEFRRQFIVLAPEPLRAHNHTRFFGTSRLSA